jgi:hypothetical protein
MAYTVTVSISTEEREFFGSIVSGGIKVMLGESLVQVLKEEPYEAIFENVEPGSYPVAAVAVDVDDNPISDTIRGAVVIDSYVPPVESLEEGAPAEASLPKITISVPKLLVVKVS